MQPASIYRSLFCMSAISCKFIRVCPPRTPGPSFWPKKKTCAVLTQQKAKKPHQGCDHRLVPTTILTIQCVESATDNLVTEHTNKLAEPVGALPCRSKPPLPQLFGPPRLRPGGLELRGREVCQGWSPLAGPATLGPLASSAASASQASSVWGVSRCSCMAFSSTASSSCCTICRMLACLPPLPPRSSVRSWARCAGLLELVQLVAGLGQRAFVGRLGFDVRA